MAKTKKIPTILGLIILVISTFVGVFFLGQRQVFRLGASSDAMPKNLRISNISDSSLTLSWTTDKESLGFVLWGDTESKIVNIEKENDLKSFTHSITVNGLSPQKKYFFKINSEGTVFDNEGIPWSATTGKSLAVNKDQNLISGSLITAAGDPVKNALVYANISGYLLSTISSASGNFVFQLGNARIADLTDYLIIDEKGTLIEIIAHAPPIGIASAQVFPVSAKPVPPIIIGQTHDFKNLPPSTVGDSPSAELSLPEENFDFESGFDVLDEELSQTSEELVTLESVDQGEQITSTKPEFFGSGPKGEELTITVESENPVTQTVKVASNGLWKWTPPTNLAPGAHKITINWIDINGIKRQLTRSFIVQAGEAPAFEASGSASLATPTPTPLASPKPTASAGSPSPVSSLIPDDVPETGSLTPTIIFTILGIGIMSLSFVTWKYAEEMI